MSALHESHIEQDAQEILWMLKREIELAKFGGWWQRLLSMAIFPNTLRIAMETTTAVVNSSEEWQMVWKDVCAREPVNSRYKQFLERVLKTAVTPLPQAGTEEQQAQRRARMRFLRNQVENDMDRDG